MNDTRKLLCATYVLFAVAALFATWSHNLAFMAEVGFQPGAFFAFWRACFVNHPASSITYDVLLLSGALFVWMGVESRRHGVRFVWVYVLLSVFVAVSVMVPLFLIARERRLALGGEDLA
jgi:hypothetical protein